MIIQVMRLRRCGFVRSGCVIDKGPTPPGASTPRGYTRCCSHMPLLAAGSRHASYCAVIHNYTAPTRVQCARCVKLPARVPLQHPHMPRQSPQQHKSFMPFRAVPVHNPSHTKPPLPWPLRPRARRTSALASAARLDDAWTRLRASSYWTCARALLDTV